MNLSPHFSVAEFVASQEACRRGINNDLPVELLANARRTAEILERVRAFLCAQVGKDAPITLTSGYRCQALNAALGSKPGSDHTLALAADLICPTIGRPTDVAKLLARHIDELGIGQLINEFPGAGGWVHIGLSTPANPINRIITMTAAGVTPGIHERTVA